MGIYEVTVGQYRPLAEEMEYEAEIAGELPFGWRPEQIADHDRACRDHHRSGTADICEWLSRTKSRTCRLPPWRKGSTRTPPETTTPYYCGEEPESLATANFNGPVVPEGAFADETPRTRLVACRIRSDRPRCPSSSSTRLACTICWGMPGNGPLIEMTRPTTKCHLEMTHKALSLKKLRVISAIRIWPRPRSPRRLLGRWAGQGTNPSPGPSRKVPSWQYRFPRRRTIASRRARPICSTEKCRYWLAQQCSAIGRPAVSSPTSTSHNFEEIGPMSPYHQPASLPRRDFLLAGGALAAATALGATSPAPADEPKQPPAPHKSIGIQVGAVSFVDEGTEPVLDILQERGAVDTIYLTTFTYGRGLAGRQIPGQPFPDHGIAGIRREDVPRRQLRHAACRVLSRHAS